MVRVWRLQKLAQSKEWLWWQRCLTGQIQSPIDIVEKYRDNGYWYADIRSKNMEGFYSNLTGHSNFAEDKIGFN